MKKYSAEWVESEVRNRKAYRLDHHECSLCGWTVAYLFHGDGSVWFDPSCNCTSGDGPRRSSFDEIAHWLEMQTDDCIRDKIMERLRCV